MAKKEIKWTLRAIHDKLDILDYWIERNKSKTFSEKLDILFDKSLESLSIHPRQGKKTDYRDIRIKTVRHYLIYYRIQDKCIEVIRIWDARRNPNKFKII